MPRPMMPILIFCMPMSFLACAIAFRTSIAAAKVIIQHCHFCMLTFRSARPYRLRARAGRTGWNDGRADRRTICCFRPRPARGRSRATSMRRSRTCRSSARTATPIRAGMRSTSRFPIRRSCSIVPDHYIFRMLFSQGVQAGGSRRADARRLAGRDRRPEDLAALRRELSSLSRHADAALVRLCAVRPVRHRRAADGQRRPTRITTRSPRCSQTDAYRPRALFKRFNIEVIATTEGALDDLQVAPDDPRQRLGRARRHRLSARTRSSIRISRALPPISTGSARSPAATPAHGPAISTPIASAAPISRNSARPRATTAIRPPRRPIFPTRRPRNCSTASGAARTTSASGGCSARRC